MTKEERERFIVESYRQAKAEIATALEARDAAQVRLDKANAAHQAWKTIIEQSGLGVSEVEQPTTGDQSAHNGFTLPGIGPATAQLAREVQAGREAQAAASKADFVYKTIVKAGSAGASVAEIKAAALKAGIEIYSGYPYTVVYKLKERGKIAPNNVGRYVAKQPTHAN